MNHYSKCSLDISNNFSNTKENGPHIAMQAVWNMAGVAGLEPATVGFGDRCSTNWNYTPVDVGHYAKSTLKGKGLFMTNLIN